MRKKLRVIERKLGRERAWGQATSGEFLIEIDPRQHPREYMDTILHEALHIIEPDWTERKVSLTARRLSELMWGMGYRRIYKGIALKRERALPPTYAGVFKRRDPDGSRTATNRSGFRKISISPGRRVEVAGRKKRFKKRKPHSSSSDSLR